MSGLRSWAATGVLAVALGASLGLYAPAVAAIDLPALERLLQAGSARTLKFDEERSSPWLSQPVISSGQLRRVGDVLEKQIEHPERALWRLLPDRMVWIDANGSNQRLVAYASAPAAGALAQALRQLLAGELMSLGERFSPALGGDAASWTLRLQPREPALARAIDYLEVAGRQGTLERIVLAERSGAMTTTRLHPAAPTRSSDVRP